MHGLDRSSAWPEAGVVTWFPTLVHGWFRTEAKCLRGPGWEDSRGPGGPVVLKALGHDWLSV